MGGAAVAYAESSLEERGGGFAEFEDQADAVIEKRIVFVGVGVRAFYCNVIVLGRLKEALHVFGLALRLPEVDYGGGFFLADIGGVEAGQAAGAGGEEKHVSAA